METGSIKNSNLKLSKHFFFKPVNNKLCFKYNTSNIYTICRSHLHLYIYPEKSYFAYFRIPLFSDVAEEVVSWFEFICFRIPLFSDVAEEVVSWFEFICFRIPLFSDVADEVVSWFERLQEHSIILLIIQLLIQYASVSL